jgi:hypothetical protein
MRLIGLCSGIDLVRLLGQQLWRIRLTYYLILLSV